MEHERWELIKEIFDEALRHASYEREQFLDENCDGDGELRREVESLLSSFDSANSFLQKPAVGEVADVVVGTNNHLSEGRRLSHYEIIRQIGAGGMGEVYLAEDTKLNRRVAIKLLPTSLSSDQNANRRLLREARAAATLDHPHICQIHEIAETDGRSFIVMQYVEGETLAEKLEREDPTLGETLDLAIQIADALATAHSHQVIHRDIKPANIINNQGQAKILDFGLAKIISEKLNVESEAEAAQLSSAANMIIGTVPYMSPEQVCGKPLDARTDIFSFGVLLYEMLSGKNLFSRESQAETISAVLSYEPPIAKTLADTPPELQSVVRKALIKNRDERYQTVKDLLVDLKGVQKRLEFEAELFRERENAAASSNVSASLRPSVSESPLPPNNLPENLSPIIGREKEITAIRDLLQSENVQLITMTGIGGTGKTRLAQALARRLLTNFDSGVFSVELAAVTDTEQVASSIAQTLGVKEAGEKPILEILKDYLRDKRMLIVVDNFEQVIDAAPKIAELLSAASKLKILITSRMPLHLSAEREFAVPPLTVPSANLFDDYSPARAGDSDLLDDLQKYEAVKLFIERARNAKSNFALTAENARSVAEICSRLDGLPLAIELAAARIKILSPQAILSKLGNRLKLLTGGARDLPARQQTMRGAVEWSYELLSKDEKRLFRRLAVFAGGFTIESAEAVCPDYELQITNYKSSKDRRPKAEDQIDVLDLITSLVHKSLFVAKEQSGGECRFRMLEVVREYALESLEASSEAEAMRQSHAAYFLALGEEAAPHLQAVQSPEWFNRLEEEYDNLQAVLWWSCEQNTQIAARLAASLESFWIHHGQLKEGRKWFEEVLKLGDNIPASVHFKLLIGAAKMAQFQGDHKTAQKMYEEGLAVSRRAGDLRQVALSNRGLGFIATEQGNFTTAREYVEESFAISRQLNDLFGIAASLYRLGDIANTQGDYATARPQLEKSLAIFKQLGKKDSVCNGLNNLGIVAFSEGDIAAARSHFGEALTVAWWLGDKTVISYALDGFAALAVERGDAERATQFSGAAERLRELTGQFIDTAERRFRAAYIAELKTKMHPSAFAEAFEQGRNLKLEEAVGLCLEETVGYWDRPGTQQNNPGQA